MSRRRPGLAVAFAADAAVRLASLHGMTPDGAAQVAARWYGADVRHVVRLAVTQRDRQRARTWRGGSLERPTSRPTRAPQPLEAAE